MQRLAAIPVLASAAFSIFLVAAPAVAGSERAEAPAGGAEQCSILVYHRFVTASYSSASMTVRTSTFRWQLEYLRHHGYTVTPLRALVDFLQGRGPAPPARCVVLTADDGHASVFTEMLPLVREYRVPVTLFVYPSAISRASYALTWDELVTLVQSGLFDVQSHTYWHPDFKVERRRLSAEAYRGFVSMQLRRSREVLEEHLGVHVDFIAWPFGIYDDDLIAAAREEGYVAGFTLTRRPVRSDDSVMALPRLLVSDASVGAPFEAMLPR